MKASCFAAFVALAVAVAASEAPQCTLRGIGDRSRYLNAIDRVVSWTTSRQDLGRFDPVELERLGLKGKKKLAELLNFYQAILAIHDLPKSTRDAVEKHTREAVANVRRPEYHNLGSVTPKVLQENSMSYLRVLSLMPNLGLSDGETFPEERRLYMEQIAKAKRVLDDHMESRGAWQRRQFKTYYEEFGLELPPVLVGATSVSSFGKKGSLLTRLPEAKAFSKDDMYELTHLVFAAYNYGKKNDGAKEFSAEEIAYLTRVLPQLVDIAIEGEKDDIGSEFVLAICYMARDVPRFKALSASRRAVKWLLDRQNADGSWGRYEDMRRSPGIGDNIDGLAYLHTCGVVAEALESAFSPNGCCFIPRQQQQQEIEKEL